MHFALLLACVRGYQGAVAAVNTSCVPVSVPDCYITQSVSKENEAGIDTGIALLDNDCLKLIRTELGRPCLMTGIAGLGGRDGGD